jgi:ribosomal protein L31
MGNHVHLVCRTYPETEISDQEVMKSHTFYCGEERRLSQERLNYYRKRWCSLSQYVEKIKGQTLS